MASIPWAAGENLQSLLLILGNTGAECSIAAGELTVGAVGQAELEAAAAAYEADEETHVLAPMRDRKKLYLYNRALAFSLGRYAQGRRDAFHMLLTECLLDNLTNRAAYIRTLLDWLKLIVAHQIQAETEVDAATTRETIKNVAIDFDALRASDPGVTIEGALAIPN